METQQNGHGSVAGCRARFKKFDVSVGVPHQYAVCINLENYSQVSIFSSVLVADAAAASRAYTRARAYCRALSGVVPGDRYRVEVFAGSNGCGKLVKRSKIISGRGA